MRAVIYPRVSSDKQREQHTIDSQLSTLPAFVSSRGWKLVRPPETYVDDGRTAKSGHLDARKGFTRLLRDAAAGVFDVVVVVDLDRLTRSEDITERGAVIGAFQRAGVKIAVASKGQVLDLSTDEGDLLAGLEGYFSAAWVRKHRERIKRGKDRAIGEGRKPAGPTPFGLGYDRVSGKWSIDKPAAEVVREIFRRVAAGEGCWTISNDLQARGIARRWSRCWTRERVWALVTCRTYRGEWVADKKRRLVVPVPALVTAELWDKAAATLAAYGKKGLRRTKHVYLLEGIAACDVCGSRIVISSGCAPRNRPAYYVCHRRLRPGFGEERCTLHMRRVADVDGRVWVAVAELLERPDHLERAIAKRTAAAKAGGEDWEGDLRGWEAKLRRGEIAEKALLERFRKGLISEAALDDALTHGLAERQVLGRQIDTARERLASSRRDHGDAAAVLATVATLRARLTDATPETKRDLVRVLVPGRGDYVVRLGAEKITAVVVVTAAAGETAKEERREVVLRVVA